MSLPRPGWTQVTLGDVCEFKYGKSLTGGARRGVGFPVYGSNGVVGENDAPLTPGPTVIIGRKGSFGEVHYSPTACWPIDTTYFVDESATACDLRWLSYRLAGLGLKMLNRSAAIPGLNREEAYRQRLLLPPPIEQRRIAEMLDRADALRTLRREASALLDGMSQAVFREMFIAGTQAFWPVLPVVDIALASAGSIRTGPFGSQLLHSEFTDEGVAVLGIDNAVQNQFAWGARRYISEQKYAQLKRYTVRPGDVLITIMGTCGRCAVVPDDIPKAINTKHLCCVTLERSKCLPEFLHAYFLFHPAARQYFGQTAKGAIMEGLNMAIIKQLPVVLPPIGLQRQYVSQMEGLAASIDITGAQSMGLDTLAASLQQRAFTGQF